MARFEMNRGFGRRPDFDRRDFGKRDRRDESGEHEMFRITCDKCGKKSLVPFRPTSSKPVYCNECFNKKDKSTDSSEFDRINEKLNKIMKALKIE